MRLSILYFKNDNEYNNDYMIKFNYLNVFKINYFNNRQDL
jgi:hypothetical protein